MQIEGGRIVETAIEARGGLLGRAALVVLIVSTGLTLGLFVAVYIGFFAR